MRIYIRKAAGHIVATLFGITLFMIAIALAMAFASGFAYILYSIIRYA